MATSNVRQQVAQQWNVTTGTTQYPFCTDLVCTLFCIALPARVGPARVRGETKVVSTASCAFPHSGRPFAMT